MDLSEAFESVLADSLYDYPSESFIWSLVRPLARSATENNALALDLIDLMLSSGYFIAGDLGQGSQFSPWPGGRDEWVERIEADWRAWGDEVPTPGSIVWFAATESGREAADKLLS